MPSRFALPAITSDRQPIRPAHNKRRDRNIVAVFAERKSIARVGDGVRGETAVPRVSGEERTVAEIFHALPAVAADAAGVSEPGDSDAFADPVCGDVAADEVDAADDFMARERWDI